MADTLEIFGTEYTGVIGIKATDDQSGTKVYIRPQGTKSISANGTGIDVTAYASVDVSVSGGVEMPIYTAVADSQTQTITVTCDWTYSDVFDYYAVNGNIPALLRITYDGTNYTKMPIALSLDNSNNVYGIVVDDIGMPFFDIIHAPNDNITAVFPSRILEQLSVTQSGTYYPPQGKLYSEVTVPSGTAGTPAATKGTVSNHSVSVTPSVTNQTGYITGSTKTGTAVTVSASELVSGNLPITQNGNNIDCANYSTVSVNVSGGTSKNTQVVQGTTRTNSSTLTAIGAEMTVSKTGTYDVYWSGMRSNTSSSYTWGTQLYVGGSAYGSENTTWSNNVQNNHLTNVSLTANQKLRVYGRNTRGTSYYMYAPTLVIVEA